MKTGFCVYNYLVNEFFEKKEGERKRNDMFGYYFFDSLFFFCLVRFVKKNPQTQKFPFGVLK